MQTGRLFIAKKPLSRERGFTMVELMVVMAIIAILSVLLFPVVGRAMNNARTTGSISNLRQIHQLVIGYVADNRGQFPKAVMDASGGSERFWRREVWEHAFGPFEGDVMSAMGGSYAKVMWCPVMLQEHGQEQHPGGRGSYGMNAFFNQSARRFLGEAPCIGLEEPYIMAGNVFAEPNGQFGTNEEINKGDPEATDWQSMAYVYGGSRDMGLALYVDGKIKLIPKEEGAALHSLIADYMNFP